MATLLSIFLSCPEQGVIRAAISTIHSTETEGKAKLQAWPGTASKLAKTPEKQPKPVGAGVMLSRVVVPGCIQGSSRALPWDLAWADELLQTVHEHLHALGIGPLAPCRPAAQQPCEPLSCRACLDLPVPGIRRRWTLSTETL